ncbi:MAG: ribonuclease domain-containing protein [Beijerinckiaceae bacterium]|jgi:hypothetical protein
MQVVYLRKGFHDPRWPADICRTIMIGEKGLVFGKGSCLARMSGDGRRLDLEADEERLLVLLSVTYDKAISRDMLRPLEAAAKHWERGDKALANLRLVFANLPPLAHPHDAYRLSLAESLLDQGMTPRGLMKELGLDPAALGPHKYNPGQPRVPAGSGRESGRGGPGEGGEPDSAPSVRIHEPEPKPAREARPNSREPNNLIIPVAADGPFRPGGIEIVPHPEIDPLDPQGLNVLPPSPEEVLAINDTVNAIVAGQPEDISTLNPHDYKNRPDKETGAVLPSGIGGYTTYYMRSPGQAPGDLRIIMDKAGNTYYTKNHYKSFYPVDLRIGGANK